MNLSRESWRARGRVPSWVGACCVLALCAMWSHGAYAGSTAGQCQGEACKRHEPPPRSKLSCPNLNGLTIRAREIGLPTTGAVVTSTTQVAASGSGATATGSYCLVAGAIHPVDPSAPDILFNVALPDQWNGKILMLGGGGFDGSIPAITGNVPSAPAALPGPLSRGYAVFASDSGHEASNGSVNGAFSVNAEAYDNFMGEALKKTHDASLVTIDAHYGTHPSRAYFAGGSTGGREALTVAQRWPRDWDGIIAFYPAYDFTTLSLQQLRVTEGFAAPGAYLDTAQRALLLNAVMQACDGLDGVVDGLISNVQACNATFNPATASVDGKPLRCAGGIARGDTCLSDRQIAALNTMNTPLVFAYPLESGETLYPGYNVYGADLGVGSSSPLEGTVTTLALGTTQPSYPLQSTAMFDGQIADDFVRYTVMDDPDADSLQYNPAIAGRWSGRVSMLSGLDATDANLTPFMQHGGKLLMAHGTVDQTVSTRATEIYYQRMLVTMGFGAVGSFARFYEIPGLQHAVGTEFNASWDSLTTLENWVEHGTPPAHQVVTDTEGVPGRTRPLCQYPAWPSYNGAGDVNSASSFTCVQ
ncbi:tannase/feruloyl esterase family alpha/beta hydrolase [Paraburkholderia tuberum]|uniref:Feruloyl esterase n=1 Tax=Paraburkholderia tuberum TaxID=157910 RepID=A0A1H1J740_9BURK|nr:tannase/feruloyl esterase family alpha/beta hydrolase [Paraburkholderia tuberum]SDR45723.1 feruloyl esterase [Paraburkholderia tuberum]